MASAASIVVATPADRPPARTPVLAAAARAATDLLAAADPDLAVPAALRDMGSALGLDALAMATRASDESAAVIEPMRWRHEWRDGDQTHPLWVPPTEDGSGAESQAIPGEIVSDAAWFQDDVAGLPAVARAYFEFHRAGSVFSVPVHVEGRHRASLVGVSAVPRAWRSDEVEALRLVAAAVGASMQRFRAVEREASAEMRIAAERARAEAGWGIAAHLQAVAAGARKLVDTSDFEVALLAWLAEMGQAAGAARAAYYDTAIHHDSGLRTLRALTEWTRDGVDGSFQMSFAKPLVIDPRGAEELMEAALGSEIVAFHADEAIGPIRAFLDAQGNATVLTVPIRLDGQTRFALSLDYLVRREPSAAELAVLRTAADSLVAVLKRREAEAARLDAERERSALLAAVNEAGTRLLTPPGAKPPIGEALAIVGAAMRLDAFVYGVFEEPDESSFLGYIRWTDEWLAARAIRSVFEPPSPSRANLADQAVHMPDFIVGRETFSRDTAALPRAMRDYLESHGVRALFAVPVLVDGVYAGSLSGVTATPRYWKEAEVQALHLLAAAIGSTLSRERQVVARIHAEAARAEEAQAAAAALARRRDLLEAVVAASDRLLAAESVEEGALEVVTRIGPALAADRIMVGRFLPPDGVSSAGYVHFFSEWTAAGVNRQTDDPALTILDMTHYLDFFRPLQRGEAVQMITDEISHEAGQAEQEATGAQSQFQYPIMVDGELWGTIGADDCRARRQWDEAEIATLRLVASALGSVVARERLSEARLAAERELAEERARMARDIHDTLAQGFTGVIMQLHAAHDALEAVDPPAVLEHLNSASSHARLGLSEARRSVFALRPPLLDDGDLPAAMRRLIGRITEGIRAQVSLHVHGAPSALAEPIQFAVFRVAQEALGNALRHARARRVDVTLDYQDAAHLSLIVQDDGVGFAPDEAAQSAGFGLVSMRERAARIGAALTLASTPGEGVAVRLQVRLSARDDDAGKPMSSAR